MSETPQSVTTIGSAINQQGYYVVKLISPHLF